MRYHFRIASILFPLTFLCSTLVAQSPCDSLFINQVRLATFNDSLIHVEVDNQSSTLFSYPGFVLLTTTGDTLAKETVNFFGIGGQQVHFLKRYYGTAFPNTAGFSAQLHLWSGFYQQQECAWNVTVEPCPQGSCAPLFVYMINSGGALVSDTLDWEIIDSANQVVANGAFDFTTTVQAHTDSICLSSGSFRLEVESPLFTGGQLSYGLTDSAFYSSGVQSIYQQGAISNTLNFEHYKSCSDLNNAILENESVSPLFSIITTNEGIILQLNDVSEAAILSILDSQGKQVVNKRLVLNNAVINLSDCSAGLLLITVENSVQRSTIKYMANH